MKRNIKQTSLYFKSDNGSTAKSKTTEHCRSFWINNSSRAAGSASKTRKHMRIHSSIISLVEILSLFIAMKKK